MNMKRVGIIGAVVIVIVAALLAFRHFYAQNGVNTLPKQYYAQRGDASPAAPPALDHIIIILEENKPLTSLVGSDDAPYFNALLKQYATAGHYYAVTHPSLPNYIALTSGTTAGISSDCNPPSATCQAVVPNIAGSLENAHKTWKAYMESMPAACTTTNAGDYAVKHNPFLYYPDIRSNTTRCRTHDVPFSQFVSDLKSTDTLPDYAFISPNLCNDMHNCPVKTGDNWLAAHVPAILSSPAFTQQHSLLVIVWDEGDSGDNNVPIVFAGPAAKQGYTSAAYYSHYSLLRTIETVWKLPTLTDNDRSAPLMTDMLR